MRCDARQYARLARHGPATAVSVRPTGTAVEQYQVPLGNRHSLREAGVIGLPSWSDKSTQTETWAKVPRLSATCPRRIVAFDGGRGNIDRTMEFGDDFSGSALDTAKWTTATTTTVGGGVSTGTFHGTAPLGSGHSAIVRAMIPSTGATYRLMGFGYADSSKFFTIATYGGSPSKWSIEANPPYTETTGTTTTDLNYHRFEIRRTSPTGAAYFVDGVSIGTNTGPIDSLPLANIYGSSSAATWDWGFVRKWVANEPIAGTAAPNATNRALSRPLSAARAMQMAVAG